MVAVVVLHERRDNTPHHNATLTRPLLLRHRWCPRLTGIRVAGLLTPGEEEAEAVLPVEAEEEAAVAGKYCYLFLVSFSLLSFMYF